MDEKSENHEGLIPRITVAGGDDRMTVTAALLMYCHAVTVKVQTGFADLDYAIREISIAADLMKALRDQDAADAAQEVFATTETFADFFRAFGRRFGEESQDNDTEN